MNAYYKLVVAIGVALVCLRVRKDNRVMELLDTTFEARYAHFLTKAKQLQRVYHPDSATGNAEKYVEVQRYLKALTDGPEDYFRALKDIYHSGDLYESSFEKHVALFKEVTRAIIILSVVQLTCLFSVRGFWRLLVFNLPFVVLAFIQVTIYFRQFYYVFEGKEPECLAEEIAFGSEMRGLLQRTSLVELGQIFSMFNAVLFTAFAFLLGLGQDSRMSDLRRLYSDCLLRIKDLQHKRPAERRAVLIGIRDSIALGLPKDNLIMRILKKLFKWLSTLLLIYSIYQSVVHMGKDS